MKVGNNSTEGLWGEKLPRGEGGVRERGEKIQKRSLFNNSATLVLRPGTGETNKCPFQEYWEPQNVEGVRWGEVANGTKTCNHIFGQQRIRLRIRRIVPNLKWSGGKNYLQKDCLSYTRKEILKKMQGEESRRGEGLPMRNGVNHHALTSRSGHKNLGGE